MTCIIGLVEDGQVYIGADSASVDTANLICRATKINKVFKRGPFIIGYTTSFRMGQILENWLEVPKQASGQSNYTYMVKEFVEAVRSTFKDKGFGSGADHSGGKFLVGYNGGLYFISNDFQVNPAMDNFVAVGCGNQFALGAMAALADLEPRERIRKALKIAAHFSAGVCPPFRIKVI
jgi:ATP-dependent protease HslVU (ClpYQ) peptidase subunit